MIHLGGKAATPAEGRHHCRGIASSTAQRSTIFKAMVEAQGGDTRVLDDPGSLPRSQGSTATSSRTRAAFCRSIDCEKVGWAVQRLGAGREKAGEAVSRHAGIEMHVKLGARIAPGSRCLRCSLPMLRSLVEPEHLLREAARDYG